MKQSWMMLLCCALLMAGPASGPPAQAVGGPPNEQVVTLGGKLWTMAADGQQVYLVEGASLVVLDMTDPAAPRPLGRVPLANNPTALEVADGFVYALVNNTVWTLDVRDPARPVHIYTQRVPGLIRAIKAAQGTLAVMTTQALLAFDLDDPAGPAKRGVLALNNPSLLAMDGDIAYVLNHANVNRANGLLIVDIGGPGAPRVRSTFIHPALSADYASFGRLLVDSGRVVITRGETQSRLLMVDVTNPDAPVLQSDLPPITSPAGLDGNLLVGVDSPSQIRLFDLANPASPQPVGAYTFQVELDQLLLHGERLYALGDNRLLALDVSDPTAPQLLGSYSSSAVLRTVWAVQRDRERLYAITAAGLQIFDVSDPLTPTLQGFAPFAPTEYEFAGDWLYAVDEGTLRIFDLSNPNSPVLRTSIPAVQDVDVDGGRAYVITPNALRIYNISDPGSPALLSELALPAEQNTDSVEVWAAGQRAYVGRSYRDDCYCDDDGCICITTRMDLLVVDVADPSRPQARGRVDTIVGGRDPLAIVGTAVYQPLTGTVIDASDPDKPTPRTIAALEGVRALQIDGTRAYAAGMRSLRTLDLSDPLNPRVIGELLIGELPTTMPFRALAVVAGRAYVSSDGLRVVDVSDPANPRPQATYNAPVVDLAADGAYAYLAMGLNGLRIVRIDPSAFPRPVYLPMVTAAE